jgi:hypothetical protein
MFIFFRRNVMKKLIIPLLFIFAFSILAAVESEPSEVVGYVKYPCVAGDNFVAMPMNDGHTLVSEVTASYNATEDIINTVNIWDPTFQIWNGSPNLGNNYFDPDLEVGPGSVLFLTSYQALDFYSIGSMPATNAQYNIVIGDNTIMVPLNKSSLTSVSLLAMDMGPSDEINTINLWDQSFQLWSACLNLGGNYFDPDPAITIATPLFLTSYANFIWPPSPRTLNSPSLRSSK